MWSRRGAKSKCSGVRGKKLKSGGRRWKRREEVCFKEMKWMVQSEPLPKVSHKIAGENKGAARVEGTEGRQGAERNKGSRDGRVCGGSGKGERVGGSRGRTEKRAHQGKAGRTREEVGTPPVKSSRQASQ